MRSQPSGLLSRRTLQLTAYTKARVGPIWGVPGQDAQIFVKQRVTETALLWPPGPPRSHCSATARLAFASDTAPLWQWPGSRQPPSAAISTGVVCSAQSISCARRSGLKPMTKSFPWATTGTPAPPVSSRHSRRKWTSLVMSSSSYSQFLSSSQALASLQ